MDQTKTILFICTGNTCRSYMAETIGKHYLAGKEGAHGIQLVSAGTGSFDNEPASVQARAVMEEMGYDPAEHRAKSLTVKMIRESHLVLTMTASQKRQVLALAPDAADKVFLLREYSERDKLPQEKEISNLDVTDPFGMPAEYYRFCALELQSLVTRAIDKFAGVK